MLDSLKRVFRGKSEVAESSVKESVIVSDKPSRSEVMVFLNSLKGQIAGWHVIRSPDRKAVQYLAGKNIVRIDGAGANFQLTSGQFFSCRSCAHFQSRGANKCVYDSCKLSGKPVPQMLSLNSGRSCGNFMNGQVVGILEELSVNGKTD